MNTMKTAKNAHRKEFLFPIIRTKSVTVVDEDGNTVEETVEYIERWAKRPGYIPLKEFCRERFASKPCKGKLAKIAYGDAEGEAA